MPTTMDSFLEHSILVTMAPMNTIFLILPRFTLSKRITCACGAYGGINTFRLPGFLSLTPMTILSIVRALTVLAVAGYSSVYAQPSPEVQRRITAAIKAAVNASTIDYTAFVNPFIGTGT
ncbi:hypothetical protein EDB87DRAFT_115075 [Lactarius vividus]|nr:hypothetical protein EDB87DRAFT_115075 [Lactarius vividus]